MNRYKYIIFLVLLLGSGFIFMNYGNINSHPSINRLIVKEFLNANYREAMSQFKNYKFTLYKPKLKGSYITKNGLFNPSNSAGSIFGDPSRFGLDFSYTEEPRSISAEKWIEHGGYSADVPEVPASLRHFYDPTRKKGERYLTDEVMKLAENVLQNPKTNGVDWALGTGGDYGVLEHIYTWEHGKKYMQGALEQPNMDKRNNYMAKAWRSLGETLHMIADNGCPPHVRNDGHPDFLLNLFDVVEMFGNPDPYEELIEVKDINKFNVGSIPYKLRDSFRAAKTARDIAHDLAVFTNENFFTNETITGTDRIGNTVYPITNPQYIYKSPKISIKNYDDWYYRRKIGKKEVLLCTDKWFFGAYNIPSNAPHIDEKCVESQAKVLIPAIKEAGVNVMKLFIPKLKLEITDIRKDGYIAGIIKHTTDREYKKEIKYNGPIYVKSKSSKTIATIAANNGNFHGTVENANGVVFVEIDFGGISVRSEDKKFPDAQSESKSFADKDISAVLFEVSAYISTTEGEKNLSSFTKNSFSNEGKVQIGFGGKEYEERNYEVHKITNNSSQVKAQITKVSYHEPGGHNRGSEGSDNRNLSLTFDNYENLIGFHFDHKRVNMYGKEKETFTENYAIEVSNVPFKKRVYKVDERTYFNYIFKGDITPYLVKCEGEYPSTSDKTKIKFIKPDKKWSMDISVCIDD